MKNPVGTICCFLGALLGVLGIFLPFATAEVMGVSFSTNVFRGICLVWIAFAVLAIVGTFIKGMAGRVIALLCSILAGGGFLISFFANKDLGADELGAASDMISKGIGYWLLLIGGIVMILAGIVAFITGKNKEEA